MNAIIDAALARSRTVMSVLAVIVLFGIFSYVNIPKESNPNIDIPMLFVSVPYPGISPEDAERLIVRPLEQELQTVEGVKEMKGVAAQNYGAVSLEFEASFNKEKALADVREKVDLAKAEFPDEAEEPTINEINMAKLPVITVNISGDVPERTMLRLARDLQDKIEAIPEILEAEIVGKRDELVEVIIDPAKLAAYNVTQPELFNAIARNNRLIAAGSLDTGQGRFSVKVPGLFETTEDVLGIPIKSSGEGVVTLADITEVRRTFWDRTSIARLNGEPGMALTVVKRVGTNIIEANQKVQQVVAETTRDWPKSIKVRYSSDQSIWIFRSLENLQSSVLTAIALVMIIVVAAMGLRSAALVGIAIPTSFLMAFGVLYSLGYTVNMMVMFGMILSVGMLVDGVIVVVEFADRKMTEGVHRREAYASAAKRMFWPVVSSTLTTLVAFLPMVFWPGVPGKYMSYLPLTLIFILVSSLFVALIFLPVLGAQFGKASSTDNEALKALSASETGDLKDLPGVTGQYARAIAQLIRRPIAVVVLSLFIVVSIFGAFIFGGLNKGMVFFLDGDVEFLYVVVQGRGNMSADEIAGLVVEVENEVLKVDGIETAFTKTQGGGGGGGVSNGSGGPQSFPVDTIGTIFLELREFSERRHSREIIAELRDRTRSIPGVVIEVVEEERGPPTGKDVQVEFSSIYGPPLIAAVKQLREHLEEDPQLIEIDDTRPLPGIEWNLTVDREQAGRFGADISAVGAWVQLVTNGLLVGTYRPADADDEVDIRVRFPIEERGLSQLDELRIQTTSGLVPISNFVTREPRPLVDQIDRVDGRRVRMVRANTVEGVLGDTKVQEVSDWMAQQTWPAGVSYRFRGAQEEAQESADFLLGAMGAALFLMAIILLTQFDNFYHALLILSAVILSTTGVIIGLIVTGQVFSVVMTGTGIVALAGIVVNNNIVLIDTYQYLLKSGLGPAEAVMRTGAQRLRPVFLTTTTTICGLLPMAFQLNIDFFNRHVGIGSSESQMWVNLSTAVVAGLAFSTLLTLILTPCLLYLPTHLSEIFRGQHKGAAPFWNKDGTKPAE